MTNQEMTSITEAMAAKQTWVRKELDDFLQLWAEMTRKKISGYNKFMLYEDTQSDDSYVTDRIYLVRGIAEIDGDTWDGMAWKNWKDYLDLEDQSMSRIRKIIGHICAGLPKYYKNMQANITALDTAGMEIRDMINKLK